MLCAPHMFHTNPAQALCPHPHIFHTNLDNALCPHIFHTNIDNSVRASSQVLSERNTSQYGSLHSLASDYPIIPGNERPHSV